MGHPEKHVVTITEEDERGKWKKTFNEMMAEDF